MELCSICGTNDRSGSCHGLSQERYSGWEDLDRVHDTQPEAVNKVIMAPKGRDGIRGTADKESHERVRMQLVHPVFNTCLFQIAHEKEGP